MEKDILVLQNDTIRSSLNRYFKDGLFRKRYPIGKWDVSNVTDMSNMFQGADDFNKPLNSWNVSNVTNMSGMFSEASSFTPLDI